MTDSQQKYLIRKFGASTLGVRILILSTCALALLTGAGCGSRSQAAPAMSPPNVGVVTAVAQDIPKYGEWIATLDGSVNAQIQPQVTGYLVKQNYREGSYVRKGDVLFEIDPRPFQATLNQAKAQLAQSQARLSLTEVNVKRDTPLAEQRAIAQSQLDTEVAARLEAKANVQAAEAAVETAELNLSFTRVRSLIDGVAGTATMQMGNLVSPASVLTTVSKLDPIKAYFPISEQEYLAYAGVSVQNTANGKARHVNAMSLELVLSDGSTYPYKGQVAFTERQIDPQTGTIRLVGSFPNRGNLLRPGQFARVRALTGMSKAAILVPQRAVIEIQGTYQIAVVGPDKRVSIRSVKVGDRLGSMWMIEEGVNAGERVIADGSLKVRDGGFVNPLTEATKGQEQ